MIAITEVLLQSAIYCGVPDANTAFRAAQHVFAVLDQTTDHGPLRVPAARWVRQADGSAGYLKSSLGHARPRRRIRKRRIPVL